MKEKNKVGSKHVIFQKETLRPREVDGLPIPTQLVIKFANLVHKPSSSASNILSTMMSNLLLSYPPSEQP